MIEKAHVAKRLASYRQNIKINVVYYMPNNEVLGSNFVYESIYNSTYTQLTLKYNLPNFDGTEEKLVLHRATKKFFLECTSCFGLKALINHMFKIDEKGEFVELNHIGEIYS